MKYRNEMNRNWSDEMEALIVSVAQAIEHANKILYQKAAAARKMSFSSAAAYRAYMNGGDA